MRQYLLSTGVRRRRRGVVDGCASVLQQLTTRGASVSHAQGARQVLPDLVTGRASTRPDDRTFPDQVQRHVAES